MPTYLVAYHGGGEVLPAPQAQQQSPVHLPRRTLLPPALRPPGHLVRLALARPAPGSQDLDHER
jgi:hypothetical protein